MANITYVFSVRNSQITTGDNRLTALTPTWIFLSTLAGATPVTQPAITEIGFGQYQFAFDAEANGECSGQIDCGSIIPNASDRFIDFDLTRDSSRIQSALTSAGVVNLPQPPPLGYNVSGSGPIAINQNTGGADNLRYVDSNNNGISGASIMIYLSTDWPTNPANVLGVATTGPDGRWIAPVYVTHGTYVAVFSKIGLDGPDVSSPFTV